MWWSGWSSRATSVPVAINYTGGTSNVTVNQLQNAGQWNSLGTFAFNGSGSVTITAANGDTLSTCADAVKFTLQSSNTPPVAVIDSITPNPATQGEAVTFTGHGTDADGTIAAYEWTSSINGIIGSAASFSTSTLSAGTHTISFRVKDNGDLWSTEVTSSLVVNAGTPVSEIIIDNGGAGTSYTGSWPVSGGTNYYGTISVWSRNGATYTFAMSGQPAGIYEVFMWWSGYSSRATSVPVAINYSGGTSNVTVNQLQNAGQWNSLGTYYFDGSGSVRITAANGDTLSTCADAVKFVTTQITPPVADFSADKVWGTPPLTTQFTDKSKGIVTSWLWDFGDGSTSTEQNPSHTYATEGYYTVSLTASNSAGSNTKTMERYINLVTSGEHIYLCDSYAHDALFIPHANTLLQSMGAVLENGVWIYQNTAQGRTYFIHSVRDPDSMASALKEEGAHIIFNGHANFGLGATFATIEEVGAQEITTIRYIDDDRFTNFSSDTVSVKIDGVQYGQAYPNWLPIYKDGTNGIMPYTFSEGLPPYNYYLTYRVPGDDTVYKVELADGTHLQRFPDSATPAWFSPAGALPDPVTNPEYFIVNNDIDFNRCNFVGTWPFGKVPGGGYMGEAGYLGYNYQYHAAGTGANTATWTLVVNFPGVYAVLASWYPDTINASNAKYTINYAGGSATVEVDQRQSEFVNPLGAYYFDKGIYTISLNDNANGRVVADAVVLSSLSNPEKILQAEFNADVISGGAPLAVQFTDLSGFYSLSDTAAGITGWNWQFGDGSTSTQQHPAHTYSSPGLYTVSLRVTDSTGATDTETKTGLIAVGQTAPLRAQFTSTSRLGSDRTVVNFIDQSSGNITGWLWDFGDGAISTERNPIHTYAIPGTYTVTLTVTGPDGSNTETETDFVNNIIGLVYADNTAHHKPHFYSRLTGSPITFGKVILDTRRAKIPDQDMRYSRMFYGSCNSCSYYGGTFQRGVMFCTTGDSDSYTALNYLEYYLRGYTDDQLLSLVNSVQPIHQILNFNLKPPSLR
jgi:PKD repeat protein